ncbi:MAG: stage 0 sporulation family protein [Clostridia bacterium]|nr:stage 0 sporulation family protein [Clostridia bacterium]
MVTIAGIQFQKNGSVFYFEVNQITIKVGDYVIADTGHGYDIGEVIVGCREIEEEKRPSQIKQIIRIATQADIQQSIQNREREKEAYAVCQKKISEHQLEMKLVSVEYSFDGSKILFYFTANGRIDFRSLVKDLASVFKTRIELRQIGVRDEARMLGGLGQCGRPICCGAFLEEFQPVSIKMAKEQNLSLNPTKISGVCGRLMCCLKYEQDQYEAIRKKMPRVGKEVMTPEGPGIVTELNILKEKVTVRFQRADSYETKTFLLEDLNSRKDESADAPGAGVGWAAEGREGQAEQQGEGAEKDKSPDNQAERQGEPRPPKRPKGPKPAGNKDQAGTRNGETRPARAGGEKAEQGHKLGQPVRRENTKKPGAQNGSSAGSTANGGNAGGGTEKQPAAQPKKNASNWAQELEKAMQAIDRN